MKYIFPLILLTLFGCDFSVEVAHRSGTADNPFLEEPITERSRQFEAALSTSNLFIEKIRDDDVPYIYQNLLVDDLIEEIDQEQFIDFIEKAKIEYGEKQSVKPLQWSFQKFKEEGVKYVRSKKFVEFETEKSETQMIVMEFVFLMDTDYAQVSGFSIYPVEVSD